ARRFRWLARALVLRGVLAALAVAVALAAIDRTAHMPQLFVLPAAWLIGSVVLARYFYTRARTPIRCGPLIDAGTVVIHTHPAFAAAADELSTA
ncbi:hypothetical protein, partial [Nocardia acidivorans]|uniref:hypothetical protein n=1 Tax=Nocardia acidivorans TaxID=404580 RepID=UPI000A69EA58